MIDSAPWVTRPHSGPRAEQRPLSPAQRAAAEALLRSGTTELRVARRAQALLLMADGVGAGDIAKLLHVHLRTVLEWRMRFAEGNPIEKLADAPRSGRPRALSRKPTARSL
jgi:hypothetical protein